MKLKILILIDWFLPGNKAGGPVKSIYSMIKALEDKIDFYIITMNTDILSNTAYNVEPNKWVKYEDINVYYFSNRNFSAKKLTKLINNLSPNVIYINSFWSYKFSILPLFLKKLHLIHSPIILAPRGMLEQGAMNIKSFKKNMFLLFCKWINLHSEIIFHATSPEEEISIKNYYPSSRVILVPNLSYTKQKFQRIDKKENNLKLFSLSRISPKKNLDFAITVLNKLPPDSAITIEYDIYGNNEDKEYFRYCKELTKSLPANIKVNYKGVLTFDEIPGVISKYHFLYLPTKSENFGHAIVETLTCGRPVLISNYTPWNEVNEANCGYALPLDENIFIEKIIEALKMNNETFQTMCMNAQRFISEKLNVEKIKSEYLNLFEYAAISKNH